MNCGCGFIGSTPRVVVNLESKGRQAHAAGERACVRCPGGGNDLRRDLARALLSNGPDVDLGSPQGDLTAYCS